MLVNIIAHFAVERAENHIVEKIFFAEYSVKLVGSPKAVLSAVFNFDYVAEIAVAL